jgi:selenocysteine lyase/cysteine desulfurase
MNVAGYDDHSKVQNLRAGAARYECGTLNTIGCFGLRASIELFLEIGVRNTALRVDGLAQRLAAGAREKGFQLAVERDSASGSGIVSFAKEGVDMQAMTRRLADEGVSVAYRRGMLRAAPHFYNTNDEVDRLLSLI